MANKVEYRGGIPEIKKTGTTVADAFPDCLVVGAPGFSFKQHKIPYTQIIDVSLDPEGAKKKNYVLNVEYETPDGFKSCIVLTGKEVSQLYGALQKNRQKYLQRNPQKAPAAEAPATPSDPYAKIEKLHELKEKGILTEEEFNAKKAQLLGL